MGNKKFKFDCGDLVRDSVTGFTGVVTNRTQWMNMCNTYSVQPVDLKDGRPQDPVGFDEPQLDLAKKDSYRSRSDEWTGGPAVPQERPNRI